MRGARLTLRQAMLLCALRRRGAADSNQLADDLNLSRAAVRHRIRALRPKLQLCRIRTHGRGYVLEVFE